jgi:nitrogen fixation protein NifX
MTSTSTHEELALRIGLAARSLTDIDVRQLVNILNAAVGHPITLEKLSRLRLKRFSDAGYGVLEATCEEDLRKALTLLKGRGYQIVNEPLPEVSPYSDGDMPASIRVACTSDSGDKIDGHFGACKRFLVYQVAAESTRLIDIRSVPSFDADADKNALRAQLISDCHVLCTASIGGPAAAKVVRAGLHPMKVAKEMPALALIQQLQSVLQGSPPPWLAKVMGETPEQRVRFQLESSL